MKGCALLQGKQQGVARRKPRQHANVRMSSSAASTSSTWTDEFTSLQDRRDEAPLPLPPVSTRRRVTLVRHGQSTWNAEGRIQGSSNFSVLTQKGVQQAEVSRDMLKADRFDVLYHSPLSRAAQTASIVWGDRAGPVMPVLSLREIDLYSFQGLLKAEGKERFGPLYDKWQSDPAAFVIDGQAPVRELWYRGSLAWQSVLAEGQGPLHRSLLVVAHNAINQALVGTALGLPPSAFRRIVQTNAASTVIDFLPPGEGSKGRTRIRVERLNQGPSRPFKAPGADKGTPPRRLILLHSGPSEDPAGRLTALGEVAAMKSAELLADLPLAAAYGGGSDASVMTAWAVRRLQELSGRKGLEVSVRPSLEWGPGGVRGPSGGGSSGMSGPLSGEGWGRLHKAWDELRTVTAGGAPGTNVLALVDPPTHGALLAWCLGLGPQAAPAFHLGAGGVSVIEFSSASDPGSVKCSNYTAHLGKWAPSISDGLDGGDEEELVCGIGGCN